MPNDLCLQRGGKKVEWDEVRSVKVPVADGKWYPVSHDTVVNEVKRVVEMNNLEVRSLTHSLSQEGNRYFGIMQVARQGGNQDSHGWVMGIRNSHDKRFAAGLVAGMSVFVCDNLSFSGEVKLARKHTVHIARDLPRLAHEAVAKLMGKWHAQDERVTVYRNKELTDDEALHMIVRSYDVGACSCAHIGKAIDEWRKPRHEAFQPRTAWSLFNSFTEVLKGTELDLLSRRTTALHGLFDTHCGYVNKTVEVESELVA